jgi:hypothetical protein
VAAGRQCRSPHRPPAPSTTTSTAATTGRGYDVWVDIKEIRKDGWIVTLDEFVRPWVVLGLMVELVAGDDVGNRCPAVIAGRVFKKSVLCLDLTQFVPA